ncbi:flavodoxin family protein [Paenarthrobacter sp. JL.01a]|uniref:flavodoxin family protein n=1 Tax=Paenarthrobacter sp. JL.01a TaxID=2979324 RepID=UPI0021C7FDCD|nr:flavodoxin domain-containing protein [Paenarthrobacter sp. JL.01a]UXM93513.1 flavodoxin domain-containing protein [Paenarthrobacter sp. JL.01a]
MKALVVYESMYGNTRKVAEAIANGLDGAVSALAVPVSGVTADRVADCELLIVGGPTHVHGMSRPSTRRSARDVASATGEVDIGALTSVGVREWLDAMEPASPGQFAVAFDTRNHGPSFLTGRASKSISERLRRAGFSVLATAESFEVAPGPSMAPEELERARRWGGELARLLQDRGARK